MNRDEAIAIIRKEYLCVDRDCDIDRSCGKCDLMMPSKEPILEAYKMAIKALEQEPNIGHWILDDGKEHGRCSECGCKEDLVDGHSSYKWCSNCGAKMFEPQERSDKE